MSETLAAENNVEGSFLKYNTRLQEGLYERHFSKDQLTKSKASAKNVLHTVSYYWTFICYGFAVALVGPTIPVIADATSTPISKMGWVFTMRGLGVILGSMIGTRIYDRLNNRSHRLADLFLIGNIVLFSTVIGLIPSMTSFTSLLSLYLAFGFCAGMINMGCNLMLMFTWESQLAGMIIGLSVAAAIGNILSPLVIAYGLSFTGVYSWASGLLASSAVLMGLCQLLPEPGQYTPLPEEETELLDEQEQLFETLSDSTPQRKEPTSRFQSFLLLATVGVAMFGAIALETSFGGLLSLYLRERALALTSTTNALLNSLFWASMATGRISAVIASKYFSPALLLALSGNGVFAALSLLLALPNQTTAWIATSLMGFSIASMYPMALAFPETSLKGVQISDKLSASLIIMAASSELFIPAITTSAIGKGGANALIWTLMSISVITTVGYAGMFLWSFALKYLPKLVGRSASSDQVPLMQSNLLDSPTNSPVPLSPASEYIEKDPQRIERPATPA